MENILDEPMGHRIKERAKLYRRQNPEFARWAAGYGVIEHTDLTQVRIHEMADLLKVKGAVDEVDQVFRILASADKVASAAMWLVVHMSYARNVYLDGRDMEPQDFKTNPEGHTGGSLNMVPAYVGYLTANALIGVTRSWLMGQGHCVGAIDATNLLVDNMTRAHKERYNLTESGLKRFVRDFYSYEIGPNGRQASPLGSHVNAHTAGGMMEGGYLGFAELYYVHMPLPGERLVAFLSDGAFEEQRGSDLAPRWWHWEDSGLVAPIMIANGRRIDQRTTMAQTGGLDWFRKHLRLNGFDPIDLDGRDPASIAWGIIEIEERLISYSKTQSETGTSLVPLPYGIAETIKGFGFPGAGTNLAHALPLGTNPAVEPDARKRFNQGARDLWVPTKEIKKAIRVLNNHAVSGRSRERDHPLGRRKVKMQSLPEPPWKEPYSENVPPMEGVDLYFSSTIKAIPGLRPRVGNPDEMRSNRLNATLDLLKHRVTTPEPGVAEAVDGGVITALNEESVVCAALANKGGINLVATYEAFGVKMLGAIRQELTFSRHLSEAGRPPGWLSVPIILTSHTWENGKNEISHQDPTLCETLMAEMSDVSRVVFPPDWNSAVATLKEVYSSKGQIWGMVVAKRPLPIWVTPEQAMEMVENGGVKLRDDMESEVILSAVGGYQLGEILKASKRLEEKGISHRVVYLFEPGRFREPRDGREAATLASQKIVNTLFPVSVKCRVFLGHMRPEALRGVLTPLDIDRKHSKFLGYINQGGTLDDPGMLYINRSSWLHVLRAAAETMERPAGDFLTAKEQKIIGPYTIKW
jgi:phosphoketolase